MDNDFLIIHKLRLSLKTWGEDRVHDDAERQTIQIQGSRSVAVPASRHQNLERREGPVQGQHPNEEAMSLCIADNRQRQQRRTSHVDIVGSRSQA